MSLGLALLTAGGTPVTELRVSGGDSRLTTWNRVKADITGVPVTVVSFARKRLRAWGKPTNA